MEVATISFTARRRRHRSVAGARLFLVATLLIMSASVAAYVSPAGAANVQDVILMSHGGGDVALGTSVGALTLSPWGPLGSSGHLYIASADRSAVNLMLGGDLQWEKSLGLLGYTDVNGSAWVQMLSGPPHSSFMLPRAAVSVALEGSWTQGPFAVQSAFSARSSPFDTSSFPVLGVSATPYSVAEFGAISRLQSVGRPAAGIVPGGWSLQTGGRYRADRDRTYTMEVVAWHAADSASSAPGWRVFAGEELRGDFPGLYWAGLGVGTPYVGGGMAYADGATNTATHLPHPALLLQVGTKQTLAPTSYGPVEVGAQFGTALHDSGPPLNAFAFIMETPLSSATRLSGAIQTTRETLSPTLSLHFAPSSWEGGEVLLRWEQRVEHEETTVNSIFLGLRVRP